MHPSHPRRAFTLIELLVVIAIIAILAVVVVLVLNPAQLLAQSRDANRVSDMATLNSAVSLYQADGGSLGASTSTFLSLPDTSVSCTNIGFPSGFSCVSSTASRNTDGSGWIPLDFKTISSGSPLGSLPMDPVNSSSSGLYYSYATNGTQYELIAGAESKKYRNTVAALGGGVDVLGSMPSKNLVGWWPLNEGSGNIAYDLSGNGDNGMWNGSTTNGSYYAQWKTGTWAGTFDGNTDYIQIPFNAATQLTKFSVATWANPSGSQAAGDTAIFTDMYAGGPVNYALYFPNGSFAVVGGTYNPGWFNTPSYNLTLGTWAFLVYTYDGAEQDLYVNGSLYATNSAVINVENSGAGLRIGRRWDLSNDFLGSIADVRIYNQALSPAEIMALYNAEK